MGDTTQYEYERNEIRGRLMRATGNYNMHPSPSTARVLHEVSGELVALENGASKLNGHDGQSLRSQLHEQRAIPVPKCILEETPSEAGAKTGKTVYGTSSYDQGRIGP